MFLTATSPHIVINFAQLNAFPPVTTAVLGVHTNDIPICQTNLPASADNHSSTPNASSTAHPTVSQAIIILSSKLDSDFGVSESNHINLSTLFNCSPTHSPPLTSVQAVFRANLGTSPAIAHRKFCQKGNLVIFLNISAPAISLLALDIASCFIPSDAF
jgi:hypothetical protein